MIPIHIVLAILFIHWIADFVCQTDWMAKNKSKNDLALLWHVIIYTLIWFPFLVAYIMTLPPGNHDNKFEFLLVTFVAHLITDFFTSRLNSKLWNSGKIHWFFVAVGFDQLLHYTQLLLTYKLLS